MLSKLATSAATSAMVLGSFGAGAIAVTTTAAVADSHSATCSEPVQILAQPREGIALLEEYTAEFEALSGASFQIDYLNEGGRYDRPYS